MCSYLNMWFLFFSFKNGPTQNPLSTDWTTMGYRAKYCIDWKRNTQSNTIQKKWEKPCHYFRKTTWDYLHWEPHRLLPSSTLEVATTISQRYWQQSVTPTEPHQIHLILGNNSEQKLHSIYLNCLGVDFSANQQSLLSLHMSSCDDSCKMHLKSYSHNVHTENQFWGGIF